MVLVFVPRTHTTMIATLAIPIKAIMNMMNLSVKKFLPKYLMYLAVRCDTLSIWFNYTSIFIILSFCFCNSNSISGANCSIYRIFFSILSTAFFDLACISNALFPTTYTSAVL